MEQQQFKVSFSVGTKLLVSVVSLLLIAILFLDLSTILLLVEDKRAYTYQAQGNEALLAGRDFMARARSGVDTLRVTLGAVDPHKPLAAQQAARLQAVIDNQSEVDQAAIYLLRGSDWKSVTQVTRKGAPEGQSADFELRGDTLKAVQADLERSGYAFANLSTLGSLPLLGVFVADLAFKGKPEGMPVARGVLPLSSFGKEIKSSELTISNRRGDVLFGTDPETYLTKRSAVDDPLYASAVSAQVASGTQEYEFNGTRWFGSYEKPGLDLIVLTKTEFRKAMRSAYALTEKFVLLGCMAIGAAVVFAILFAKGLVAPLNRLYQATKEVGSGNFNVRLEVPNQRDEIGALTTSFNAMSREINDLILQKVEMVHLENEVAIASTVQQTLLPGAVYEDARIRMHAHYQAASQCGGDWWGFFGVGGKMCFMVADATGHGLPSALITASARSCFSVMHKLAEETPEFAFAPGSMLAYANRVIYDAALGKIMMTFFVGVLDFEARTLSYASAGHNPPWLFKKGEDGKFVLKSLTAIGQRLGEARDVEPYEEKTVSLSEGDILFLYTDGLMEGKNVSGDMYGKKRVRKLIEGSLPEGPRKVIDALVADYQEYNKGKALDDDITIAATEIVSFEAFNGTISQSPESTPEAIPEAIPEAAPA
jgi:sigma-B regulation protein RsbU (phosphoserine phosphatase)